MATNEVTSKLSNGIVALPDFNYHGDVVVFDLDDTLMRERDYCRSGFKLIEKSLVDEYGDAFHGIAQEMNRLLEERENYFAWLEELLASKIQLFSAPTDKVSKEDNGNNANIKDKEDKATKGQLKAKMAQLVGLYRSHVPEKLEYAEGAAELIAELSKRGVVMALITDGRSVTQRAKIKALHLDEKIAPYFIFISEERGVDKTKPDSFQEIVRLRPESKRFFYIGDNEEKDFIMGNLLGWITCKISYHHDNVHEDNNESDILKAPACKMLSFSKILTDFNPRGSVDT